MCDRIFGPFFFVESAINEHIYLGMLENFLSGGGSVLANSIIFHQDGAPPHLTRYDIGLHSPAFVGRWLGRGGSIYMTPFDFLLTWYVKNCIYTDTAGDLNNLKARISEAAEQLTRDMLPSLWQRVEYHLDICRVTS
jgi:hypothetical protein